MCGSEAWPAMIDKKKKEARCKPTGCDHNDGFKRTVTPDTLRRVGLQGHLRSCIRLFFQCPLPHFDSQRGVE